MTDIWTRVNIPAHFVTLKWELKTCLLQTIFFSENHAADNTRDKLKEIL